MLLALLAVPILEIVVAALVAHLIGWVWTLLILAALSLFGLFQLKVQGMGAWRSAVAELNEGGSPAQTVIGGALRVLGALLLIVPGLCSALVGLLLLIRPIRGRVAARAGKWVLVRLRIPTAVFRNSRPPASGWHTGVDDDDVVDVEGWEEASGSSRRGEPHMLGRPRP